MRPEKPSNHKAENVEGVTHPSTLIWKGTSKNAPDTPTMEEKNETTNATTGGNQSGTQIPAMSKNT
jgi:hypothetical protein